MGFRSLNSMKFVYVGFSLSKQQSFFSKTSLNSCLIGLDQLYTGRADEVLGERVLISELSQCVGLVITLWPCALKVLSSVMTVPVFLFLFFFFFSFPFSYCRFVYLYIAKVF